MNDPQLVPLHDICKSYSVADGFVRTMAEAGLVVLILKENEPYVDTDYLLPLERCIRIHTELGVNPEGVEVIFHLMQRLERLQQALSAQGRTIRQEQSPEPFEALS